MDIAKHIIEHEILDDFVPYTGANQNVDLGAHSLTANVYIGELVCSYADYSTLLINYVEGGVERLAALRFAEGAISPDILMGYLCDLGTSTNKWRNLYLSGNASIAGAYSGMGISPIGSVIAWLKSMTGTPALPSGWVECNGQTLSDAGSVYNGQVIPNLNGIAQTTKRFLRGSTTSGTIGGSETHAHLIPAGATIGCGTYWSDSTEDASSLPSYYEVVWIMRIK